MLVDENAPYDLVLSESEEEEQEGQEGPGSGGGQKGGDMVFANVCGGEGDGQAVQGGRVGGEGRGRVGREALDVNSAFLKKYLNFVHPPPVREPGESLADEGLDFGGGGGEGVATVVGCWYMEAAVTCDFRGLKMIQNDTARTPDGCPVKGLGFRV